MALNQDVILCAMCSLYVVSESMYMSCSRKVLLKSPLFETTSSSQKYKESELKSTDLRKAATGEIPFLRIFTTFATHNF